MFGNPYYAPYQYPNFYAQNDLYKPQTQQPVQTTNPQAQMQNTANFQPNNDMIWVLNESEAAAYPVAPNRSVFLWHKSEPILYIKSANVQGVPSMKTIDYKERTEIPPETPQKCSNSDYDKFATKDQINALQGEIDTLKTKLDKMNVENIEDKSKTTTKKTKGGEE